MITSLNQHLVDTVKNLFGWRTERQLVVIESDDWGSIRMPSKKVYDELLKHGIRVDRCPYCRYDSLASEEDFTLLFDLLVSMKDKNNNHPIITANCVVANPYFEKIEASDFQDYYFEPFTRTLERYPNHIRSFSLWQQGIAENVFYPQFHGREHLNVNRWMSALRKNMKETRLAFDHQFFGISTNITSEKRLSYMAAFDLDHAGDLAQHETILGEGFELFLSLFGYSPLSFVAPNGIIHSSLESILAKMGVRHLQSAILGFSPECNGKYKKIVRYHGKRNQWGQCYTIRNCKFEPSTSSSIDWVNYCLGQIETAFRWRKPAVICSHRVNYIGTIDPANRDNTLSLLKQLLEQILKRWPDVEFITSDKLGKLINDASQ